jgi:hypothetical protein
VHARTLSPLFAFGVFGCASNAAVEHDEPVSAPVVDDAPAALTEVCPTPSDCPYRAEFTSKFSVFAHPGEEDVLATDAKFSYSPTSIPLPTDDEDRIQVVCDHQEYWARVFVDRAALRPVTVELVTATISPGAQPPAVEGVQIGVSMVPGTAVEVHESDGEFVEVGFTAEVVRGHGWIPKSAIGQLYVPMADDPRSLPDTYANTTWRPAFEVFEQPNGAVLATIDGPAVIVPLGPRRDNHVLVATAFVLKYQTHVVGWVPAATLEAKAGGIPGGIPASYFPAQNRIGLAPGTRLVSPASGREVGIVRQAAKLECAEDCASESPLVVVDCVTTFSARAVPGS